MNRLTKRLEAVERRDPTGLDHLTDEELDAHLRYLTAELLAGGTTLEELQAMVPRGLDLDLSAGATRET